MDPGIPCCFIKSQTVFLQLSPQDGRKTAHSGNMPSLIFCKLICFMAKNMVLPICLNIMLSFCMVRLMYLITPTETTKTSLVINLIRSSCIYILQVMSQLQNYGLLKTEKRNDR